MNEKQFTIIWIVALVLIIILGGASIYYLQFEVLETKKKELAVVRGRVMEATKKKNKIPELRNSIGELEKKEAQLITRIPNMTRAEYDVFAELLDELRRKAGVSVTAARWTLPARAAAVPGRAVQPPTVHKVQYDLSVNGTFYQLLRYVNLLEQHRRFIGVENFTVSKGAGDTGKLITTTPRRDLKVVIYSYTYKLPPKPLELEFEESRAGKSTDIPD